MKRFQLPDLRQFNVKHFLKMFRNFFTDGWYFKADATSHDSLLLV